MASVFTQLAAWYQQGRLAYGVVVLGLVAVTAASLLYSGYRLGVATGTDEQSVVVMDQIKADWLVDREQLAQVRQRARNDIDALAARLGQMQAHIIRLDAVGERLAKTAQLDPQEFGFDSAPALGGPESQTASLVAPERNDLLASLDEVSQMLDSRSDKFAALEHLLMRRNLQAEVRPEGRPIEDGWVSSYFGKRTDPFSGKKEYHHGLDFAGKAGTEIVAVASGVVTTSERRSGYGELVEINHGGGYVTRYGHNRANLVAAGDKVEKGQVIALMGSTGRSTGPHVHFEVVRNGKTVNPANYLQVAR